MLCRKYNKTKVAGCFFYFRIGGLTVETYKWGAIVMKTARHDPAKDGPSCAWAVPCPGCWGSPQHGLGHETPRAVLPMDRPTWFLYFFKKSF